MTLFLEHYESNPDDDRLNAEAMLKTFYGRRSHDVSKMSDEEVLQCALFHVILANANPRVEIEGVE